MLPYRATFIVFFSSVAGGGGGGGLALPHWNVDQIAEEGKHRVLALLRLFFSLQYTKK